MYAYFLYVYVYLYVFETSTTPYSFFRKNTIYAVYTVIGKYGLYLPKKHSTLQFVTHVVS